MKNLLQFMLILSASAITVDLKALSRFPFFQDIIGSIIKIEEFSAFNCSDNIYLGKFRTFFKGECGSLDGSRGISVSPCHPGR
jgi:hypothetical protein